MVFHAILRQISVPFLCASFCLCYFLRFLQLCNYHPQFALLSWSTFYALCRQASPTLCFWRKKLSFNETVILYFKLKSYRPGVKEGAATREGTFSYWTKYPVLKTVRPDIQWCCFRSLRFFTSYQHYHSLQNFKLRSQQEFSKEAGLCEEPWGSCSSPPSPPQRSATCCTTARTRSLVPPRRTSSWEERASRFLNH